MGDHVPCASQPKLSERIKISISHNTVTTILSFVTLSFPRSYLYCIQRRGRNSKIVRNVYVAKRATAQSTATASNASGVERIEQQIIHIFFGNQFHSDLVLRTPPPRQSASSTYIIIVRYTPFRNIVDLTRSRID